MPLESWKEDDIVWIKKPPPPKDPPKKEPPKKSQMSTVHKTSILVKQDGAFKFVMSDGSPDRVGDIVSTKGWQLGNFQKNPIALFNHRGDQPIGTWSNVKVADNKLVGTLNLAPAGTSPRIDEIRALVDHGILKAVSVGFKPLEFSFLQPPQGEGILFEKQELLECSLVAVPANANSVQLAKSLKISDETITEVFGESAGRDQLLEERRIGKSAEPSHIPPRRNGMNIPLSKRIQDSQKRIVGFRDRLNDHIANLPEEPDEAANALIEQLNGEIANEEKSLGTLQRAEAALFTQPQSNGEDHNEPPVAPVVRAVPPVTSARPFAAPAGKKPKPVDYMFRAATISLLSRVEQKTKLDVLRERYGEDEPTKAVMDSVTKAASAPATTTTVGWAAELVATAILDFIDTLMPQSVYPGLSARGGRFTFGRNGVVSLPARNTTTTISGSFVGQGAPIPVRQGAFTATTLTPKKMGVISTFTREIAEHSTPSIEALIRQAIQEDTSVSIDSVLLDAVVASAIRPAGLRAGVSVTTATAGGGFNALVGDVKALVGALVTASGGNLRTPVWIMNPVQALSIAMTQNAGGDFPFAAEVNQGRLQGYTILQSTSVTAGMVFLVDASDFFSATGDDPRFDVSDQAVLHMEDTTPLAIGTAGSPNTVAAPARSLWQTDTIGIRMLLDINWAMRRTGSIVWTQAVTW